MSYTYYQAKNPTTINITDEHVTESELPERLLELNNKTQNINADGTTLSNITTINSNKIGSPTVFRYNAVTPFIPIVSSAGTMEVGDRIDFHRVTTEEDYTVGIQVAALNRLSIRHNNTQYAGDLELGTTYYKNTGGTCSLYSNQHSNLQWINNSGVNTWIMDATTAGERWSTTRDNALTAYTRTTGMTYTTEPNTTTFSNNIVVPTINGKKIGAPQSFMYNNVTPFIPVIGTDGVMEVGRYIDFHYADTTYDFWTRLACVAQNTLEITGIGSMRMTRIDVSAGMALIAGNTLLRFFKTDNSTSMLTLNNDTNEATFLGNIYRQ